LPNVWQSFEPRTYINARYAHQQTHETLVSVDLTFNTSSPCIHLDNFKQISKIKCDRTSIFVTLNSVTDARSAFDYWSSIANLTFLVSADSECNGGEVGTFRVGQIKRDRQSLEIVTSRSLDRRDIVTDWSMVVNQFDVKEDMSPRKGYFRRERRDYVETFINGFESADNVGRVAVAADSHTLWGKVKIGAEIAKEVIENGYDTFDRFSRT
jgi:hypothetical protein